MKAEYANIFIRSAMDVFNKEIGLTLSRKDLQKKDAPIPTKPVSIIVGITGFLRGQIVYAMDQEFADGVAKAMMPTVSLDGNHELVNSAISEIANIITGHASVALAGGTEKINLTPPAVLMASDLFMDFLKVPTLALSLLSEIGALEINIALIDGEGR